MAIERKPITEEVIRRAAESTGLLVLFNPETKQVEVYEGSRSTCWTRPFLLTYLDEYVSVLAETVALANFTDDLVS